MSVGASGTIFSFNQSLSDPWSVIGVNGFITQTQQLSSEKSIKDKPQKLGNISYFC